MSEQNKKQTITNFKAKYPALLERQKHNAARVASAQTLAFDTFEIDGQQIPAYVPESPDRDFVRLQGRSLSNEAFICATMCLSLSQLWADIEFNEFDFFSDERLEYLNEKVIKICLIDVEKLADDFALLHRFFTDHYRTMPESGIVECILD